MPAVWSPLNGVTVFGHPAAAASFGELNHNPNVAGVQDLNASNFADDQGPLRQLVP